MSYKKNKFLTDYEVHEYLKPNGRVGQTTTYIGEYYVFTKASHRKSSLIMTALFFLSAACFIAACSFYNDAFFHPLVTVPFFMLLPTYWFMGVSLYYSVIMKEPYERYYADYIMTKYPPAAFFMFFFSLVSCAACVILLIRQIIPVSSGNIIFLSASLLQTVSGAILYALRHENDLFVKA